MSEEGSEYRELRFFLVIFFYSKKMFVYSRNGSESDETVTSGARSTVR